MIQFSKHFGSFTVNFLRPMSFYLRLANPKLSVLALLILGLKLWLLFVLGQSLRSRFAFFQGHFVSWMIFIGRRWCLACCLTSSKTCDHLWNGIVVTKSLLLHEIFQNLGRSCKRFEIVEIFQLAKFKCISFAFKLVQFTFEAVWLASYNH